MEDRGLEPQDFTNATNECSESCVDNAPDSAANALHLTGFDSQLLSAFDSELQVVVAAWEHLPQAIRDAILVLARNGD